MSDAAVTAPITELVYYLTEACNLDCAYCYVSQQAPRSTLQIGRATVDFLIRVSADRPDLHIRFFGGEPLLQFELMAELVNYGRQQAQQAGKHIRFDLVSNGTLLDGATVHGLRQLGVPVIVSLDGTRETMEANRPFRDPGASYDGFENRVRYAVGTGVSTSARMTVSRHHTDIRADLAHLADLGFADIVVAPAAGEPWAPEAIGDVYDSLATYYVGAVRGGAIPPLALTNGLLTARHAMGHGHPLPAPSRFCGAGRQLLGVSTSGGLYPCHRFVPLGREFQLGHVGTGWDAGRWEPFATLSAGASRTAACGACEARPYCPGSCMATNQMLMGDLAVPSTTHCLDLRAHVAATEEIYGRLVDEHHPRFLAFLDRRWAERRRQLLEQLMSGALDDD